jgi:hypothetical protein
MFEDGVPPRFRLRREPALLASAASVETVPPGDARRIFAFADRGKDNVTVGPESHSVAFEEHEHAEGAATQITTCARPSSRHRRCDCVRPRHRWLIRGFSIGCGSTLSLSTPLVGIVGRLSLPALPSANAIEGGGDQITALQIWRLGPGRLGAILSMVTPTDRRESFSRAKLDRFRSLSRLTIEVMQPT